MSWTKHESRTAITRKPHKSFAIVFNLFFETEAGFEIEIGSHAILFIINSDTFYKVLHVTSVICVYYFYAYG